MANERDKNIYNDHDFYSVLLSDFLAMNDEPNEEAGDNGGGDFLYGADLSMTQKFLAKKQKLKEL